MTLRRIALGLSLAACGVLPLAAQEPDARGWTVGVGFHTAFPTGTLSKDVNDHNGFGLAIQAPYDLGGGLVLRPQVEGTGFRITRYDPFAWLGNGDDREILRTYRLGADLLVHFSGDARRPGPYVLGGIALQNASIDRVYQDSNGDSVTGSTRLSETGLAYNFGAGFRFGPHAALELRYYRFDYQDPSAPRAATATRRAGESFLLGVAFSF